MPIRTGSNSAKARIESIDDQRVRADLANGKVVIVTGFQGIDEHGPITTLGRGGSDPSAVVAAMKARSTPTWMACTPPTRVWWPRRAACRP